jgi:hypothetical protein
MSSGFVLIGGTALALRTGHRIATLDEIFRTKALVTSQRARSRDWFDLFVLMRDHGYALRDYVAAFEQADALTSCEFGLERLCIGQPGRADAGFQALIENPPSLPEMRAFSELAATSSRQRWPPSAPDSVRAGSEGPRSVRVTCRSSENRCCRSGNHGRRRRIGSRSRRRGPREDLKRSAMGVRC